jgi:hypothetical protein
MAQQNRIPLQHRGKRPRFFADGGADELVSMILELTAETWVTRKRLYLLEKVAARAGVELTPGIEGYQLSEAEVQELDQLRRRLIGTVLRSLEADHGGRAEIHADMSRIGADVPDSPPAARADQAPATRVA